MNLQIQDEITKINNQSKQIKNIRKDINDLFDKLEV